MGGGKPPRLPPPRGSEQPRRPRTRRVHTRPPRLLLGGLCQNRHPARQWLLDWAVRSLRQKTNQSQVRLCGALKPRPSVCPNPSKRPSSYGEPDRPRQSKEGLEFGSVSSEIGCASSAGVLAGRRLDTGRQPRSRDEFKAPLQFLDDPERRSARTAFGGVGLQQADSGGGSRGASAGFAFGGFARFGGWGGWRWRWAGRRLYGGRAARRR